MKKFKHCDQLNNKYKKKMRTPNLEEKIEKVRGELKKLELEKEEYDALPQECKLAEEIAKYLPYSSIEGYYYSDWKNPNADRQSVKGKARRLMNTVRDLLHDTSSMTLYEEAFDRLVFNIAVKIVSQLKKD